LTHTKPEGDFVNRCLVTGGSGFIGSHLVQRLVSAGDKVRVLDDFSTGNPDNLSSVQAKIELMTGSVTDADKMRMAVRDCNVIYHLAALPSVAKSVEDPLASHEICATGTLMVLDAARRAGVRRVVYAASSSAYGDQPGAVRTETDALVPLSPYAAAKLAGEHYCACCTTVYGLETVRLRFFNVFGPRQDAKSPYSGVIALFIAALCDGRIPTIYGDGLQGRDFVYVDNVVDALCQAAQAPDAVGKVYNIGYGRSTTILDLVKHLNRLLGTNIQPLHCPPRAGDVRNSEADISRARRDLGYSPAVTFEEGLARTLHCYRQTKKNHA
jgi:UDP-glucose 4-epimerase